MYYDNYEYLCPSGDRKQIVSQSFKSSEPFKFERVSKNSGLFKSSNRFKR